MPAVYRSSGSKLSDKGRTNYLLPLGKETLFPSGKEGRSLKEVANPLIAVVEVDDKQAVVWTKPEDLAFDAENPLNGLGRLFDDGFNAAFSDGHLEFIRSETDVKIVRGQFLLPSGKAAPEK